MQVPERILVKTGLEPSECKCSICKNQCKTPCLGTPQDIEKLIQAGFRNKLAPTVWAAGMVMGLTELPIIMIQAKILDGYCVFYKNGLCQLHDSGLKPTEGKLSSHQISLSNLIPSMSISWNVAKEWQSEDNINTIEHIISLLNGKQD